MTKWFLLFAFINFSANAEVCEEFFSEDAKAILLPDNLIKELNRLLDEKPIKRKEELVALCETMYSTHCPQLLSHILRYYKNLRNRIFVSPSDIFQILTNPRMFNLSIRNSRDRFLNANYAEVAEKIAHEYKVNILSAYDNTVNLNFMTLTKREVDGLSDMAFNFFDEVAVDHNLNMSNVMSKLFQSLLGSPWRNDVDRFNKIVYYFNNWDLANISAQENNSSIFSFIFNSHIASGDRTNLIKSLLDTKNMYRYNRNGLKETLSLVEQEKVLNKIALNLLKSFQIRYSNFSADNFAQILNEMILKNFQGLKLSPYTYKELQITVRWKLFLIEEIEPIGENIVTIALRKLLPRLHQLQYVLEQVSLDDIPNKYDILTDISNKMEQIKVDLRSNRALQRLKNKTP
ncbi:MAG: hypothetical protein H6621_01805 [Halobacteriovoraceae bacterium]|nr:hypothetical protein [Halobacteriovoraceae bacterium]MCB9093776.1 hypothetical protein [Halobacteriovoraceae bacterium]